MAVGNVFSPLASPWAAVGSIAHKWPLAPQFPRSALHCLAFVTAGHRESQCPAAVRQGAKVDGGLGSELAEQALQQAILSLPPPG